MSYRTRLVLVAILVACLVLLIGCGGSGNGGDRGNAGIVTGEIYAAVGGSFTPLGGQTAAVGASSAQSVAGTGRFTITGVSPGAFTVAVTPQPGFGEVLNPDILDGTVSAAYR